MPAEIPSPPDAKPKSQPPVALYFHTHWDREWYWPFRAYQVRLGEVVDAILEAVETQSLPCFTLDGQTVLLEDYLEMRPQNRERLKRLIEQGTLNVGPWYVMPDEFLVSGESLIRNLKKGIEQAQSWGSHQFCGYLPDTFGHSADIPTVLNLFGIDNAVVWRGVSGQETLFEWESLSRASVMTYWLKNGYFQNMFHDPALTETEAAEAFAKLQADLLPHSPVLLPIGGDHLGPLLPQHKQWLDNCLTHQDVRFIHPHQFFEDLKKSKTRPKRVILGELTDNHAAFLLPGVYSARLYLKKRNRILEHRLTRWTEPLQAMVMAWGQPAATPLTRELSTAWTELLLNHPHDSICGCSVDAVHRQNEVRFDAVESLCNALEDRFHYQLAPKPSSATWHVWNMGDQPYTGVVSLTCKHPAGIVPELPQTRQTETILQDAYLTDCRDVPMAHLTQELTTGWGWAAAVPAHGTAEAKLLALPKGITPVSVTHTPALTTLSNGLATLSIEPSGLCYEDHDQHKTYTGLHTLWDYEDQGDSYTSGPVLNAQSNGQDAQTAHISSIVVLHDGPLVSEVEWAYDLPGMALATRVRMTAGSPRIDFETRYVNRRENHKLQVAFETGAPLTCVQAESHLSVQERTYDPAYHEVAHMPAGTFQELKTNTGPIQRFIQANGQLILTEGLSEYEVRGTRLHITLLRAFGALSKVDTGVRGAQAGPPFDTPQGQCLGRECTFRYGWQPAVAETWQAYAAADHFYDVVRGYWEAAASPSRSLIRWNNPNLVSTMIKWADDGRGLLVRLLNTSSRQELTTFEVGFPYHHIEDVDGLEASLGVVESSVVPFTPFYVRTLLFCVK